MTTNRTRADHGGQLTERERQVLAGVADGKSTVEIAGELFLSPHTVKSHMRTLLRKLGARNRTHAVGIGGAAGLLTAPSEGDVS